ncbi:MAG: glycerol-3-phosphate acyltransferase [Candidatus Dormibacteria bacterium]
MSRRVDAAAVAAGYAIGSIPFGLLLSRATRGRDPREMGSGSMGTTNVLRLAGPYVAAATFALDVGKGVAAVGIARGLGASPEGQAAAGFGAMVGHSWPAFAQYRGGKSVATALGALLLLSPPTSVWAVSGGVATLLTTRIVSAASLAAAASATLGSGVEAVRHGRRVPLAFTGVAAALVALRHSDNIRRLAAGTEPRVSLRRGVATETVGDL